MSPDIKLVLIVDDDRDMLQMIGYALRAKGYDVQTATDGVEGFALAKDLRPDLLVLDVVMPNLNGYEFVRALRTVPELAQLKVIVITGRDNLQDQFKKEGVAHYFVKPFELDDFLKSVQSLIG